MNIAFAGTGYISKIHAHAVQELGHQLVAVVNHKTDSMATFAAQFGIPRQYHTIEQLIVDGGVDAIVISTPNYLHAPQSIAALQAGIAVMVEKPMALNAAEAQAMAHASTSTNTPLMVAHCWRFDEEVLWLKERVAQIGPIIRTKGLGVHAQWGPSGWFTQKQYAGGGALVDMGVHAIDTVRFLLGDPQPTSVYATLGTHYTTHDVDDTGMLIITWQNGTSSFIESGWWQPHMDGPEAATQLYGRHGLGSVFPTALTTIDAHTNDANRLEGGFVHPRDVHCPQQMYTAQMAYFVECVAHKRIPSPGIAEGLVNMRILDAAYESALNGQVVHLT